MVTALIVFTCILTVLLILVVLIQNSKGGGLAGEFGGLGSNQLMGVKKTTDLLEQITWGLGIGVMVLTLASYIMVDKSGSAVINSVNADRAQTQTLPGAAAPSTTPTPAPAPAPGVAPSQAVPGRSDASAATPGASTSALTPQK